jgi:hypothetical protein
MNKIEILPRSSVAEPDLANGPRRSSPPRAIKVLLPVWGFTYVHHFLEFSLPTLLAPGNIPALAAALPTEFVVLTSSNDKAFIQQHHGFKRLADTCATEIRLIDHLITDGNYTTTITLAYTEALRAAGAAMRDTCFFVLNSDYIMADGSLANVLKRMQSGASAVLAGNFQVVHEDALPWLQHRLGMNRGNLALPPRVLMRWAFDYLHPITLANTVNVPLSHNAHSNRLFWLCGGSAIIGRFYLIHPVCIRPEVTEFVIGSSFDYSFVPELCPSGNIEVIEDSDEYLVIEMQAREHESRFLRPGPLKVRALARSLNEWTTLAHRTNARRTVLFHVGELPPETNSTIKEADAFIAEVERRLKCQPRPHRGHFYWRGAMAAFYHSTGRRLNDDDWRDAMGGSKGWLWDWFRFRAKHALMGSPPDVLPWHPAWPDFKVLLNELAPFFTDPTQRLLVVSSEVSPLSLTLTNSGERVHHSLCARFLQRPSESYLPLFGTFDLGLIELAEADLKYADLLIECIKPLIKDGGYVIVFVSNRRTTERLRDFGRVMVSSYPRFIRAGIVLSGFHFVPENSLRRWSRGGALLMGPGMSAVRSLMRRAPWMRFPVAIVCGPVLLPLLFASNLVALRRMRRVSIPKGVSSFVMRLRVNQLKKVDHTSNFGETPQRAKLPSRAAVLTWQSGGTREPQYNRCLQLRDTIGLAPLGLMMNQVWYDDPRRLAFVLARYEFVSRILSGCHNVAEVGCGDAFGTRIVLQEVADVTVYDFDPVFIEDIRARQDERWPLKAEVHDILASPLPRRHDALFSLDVLERIASEDEHTFLSNMCASLTDHGILVVGTPSLESQWHASPPSLAGHVNCKRSNDLKSFLANYFHRVFIFSMNAEVVHTGSSPMAHYLFAVCDVPNRTGGLALSDNEERRIGMRRLTWS